MISLRNILVLVVGILLASQALFWSGCRDDRFITDSAAALEFSTDTVQFDTVFTSLGSVTRSFLVFNPHKQNIEISEVRLSGMEASQFRINVDGLPGTEFNGVSIPPEDSIYIFVEVTIDPNDENTPYVVEDSIIFITNNNFQQVKLLAWGQNAIFYDGQRVCDEVWTNEKPYVIFNYIQVDSNCTLTIKEGVRVFIHANSGILVDGTLLVEGTQDSVVTFQGDRLEDFFLDKPGQWDGIYFLRGSTANRMDWAVIKNSIDGVVAGFSKDTILSNPANRPEVKLNQVVIHDCLSNGIFALNASIQATNCLLYNMGEFNAALLLGGEYEFTHCTLANYGSFTLNHQTPVLGVSNFLDLGNGIVFAANLDQADFVNCIVEGSIVDGAELVLSDIESGLAFNHSFENCMLRTDILPEDFNNSDCVFNEDPLFADRTEANYRLREESPGIGLGQSTFVSIDLDGNPRPFMGTSPDAGAYEFGYE